MKTLVLSLAVALSLAAPLRAEEMTDDLAALVARQLYADGKYDEAVAVFLPMAERGVPRAMAMMGALYEDGLGVPQDNAQAVAWYEKAAAAGSPLGLHNLGWACENGNIGLVQDKAKAREYYTRAAAMDFGPSLVNLGLLTIRGEGGPKDAELGFALVQRAAWAGEPHGIAELAYMLATGDGAAIDLPRARDLYETAAGYRIDWAMRDFGEMLELGEGGPIDLDQAWYWYRRAASVDYALAGVDLAEIVRANPKVMADRKIEGLAWCYWAEAQPADFDGNEFEGRCAPGEAAYTPEEIAAAREMAKGL